MAQRWRALHHALHRVGIDVVRYPPRTPVRTPSAPTPAPAPEAKVLSGVPAAEVAQWRQVAALLGPLEVDLLIDVGANQGQYARGMRACGFAGRIRSFEPVLAAYEIAAAHAVDDGCWDVERIAIGREDGTAVINVAANHAASSSLLPMLDRHAKAAPHASYVEREEIAVRRLDDLLPTTDPVRRVFLKVDTQGFEVEVLHGAERLLDSIVVGLQVELSLVPLYDGGPLYLEVIELLNARGFRLARVLPGFTDPATDEMLQFDGVFLRSAG